MTKIAVTIPEAVSISGIGRTSLHNVFKAGAIRPRKHGKRTLVLVAELESYLASLPVAV